MSAEDVLLCLRRPCQIMFKSKVCLVLQSNCMYVLLVMPARLDKTSPALPFNALIVVDLLVHARAPMEGEARLRAKRYSQNICAQHALSHIYGRRPCHMQLCRCDCCTLDIS